MSAMSDLSATADQLIADLTPTDLHRLAARIASQIGCVIAPDPAAAGDPDALKLQGPITRLTAKADQYRAIASGCRKKVLQGRPGVSVQDAQNADRFADDLEVVLSGLAEAQNGRFAATLYVQVLSELLKDAAPAAASPLTTGESHRIWPSDEMRDRLAKEMAAEGDPC